MVCGVFGVLALVVLVLFWFDKEFAPWGKVVASVIYLLTWLAFFFEPLLGGLLQAVFGLGLYFLMYPSNWVSNR